MFGTYNVPEAANRRNVEQGSKQAKKATSGKSKRRDPQEGTQYVSGLVGLDRKKTYEPNPKPVSKKKSKKGKSK